MTVNRFQVASVPTVLPGKCLVTGNGATSGPFVDLGVNIKGYGRVYLQARVVEEMHREIRKYNDQAEDFALRRDERVAQMIRDARAEGYAMALKDIEGRVDAFATSLVPDLLSSGVAPADLPDLSFLVPDSQDSDEVQSQSEGDKSGSESDSIEGSFPSLL